MSSLLIHAMRYDILVAHAATFAAFSQIHAWVHGARTGGAANVSPDLSLRLPAAAITPAPPVESIVSTSGPSKKTGKTPALGWNSWNAYQCNISEAKILAAANDMVSLGLQDAGYEYVNLDDCWAEMIRDPVTMRMVPDSIKFPNGINSIASQVHELGLKIGIYSDAGTLTCAGYPGSLNMESIDAATFNDWGIDYLKYDNCNVPANWTDTTVPPHGNWYDSNSAIRYRQMAGALATQTTHPIQLSLCIWGTAHVWEWGARVGHSWRMSGDSTPDWNFITSIISFNAQHLDSVDFFSHNDMDMMEIGNGNLTIEEQRTHFASWAFMKSPILLGTDLSNLSSEQIAIITNRELLAFHQDEKIGAPATLLGKNTTDPPEFYTGQSSKGTHVFVINTSNATATKSFAFARVQGLQKASSYVVHDMWTGKDVGSFDEDYSFNISAHDTAAYLIIPS